MLRSDYKWRVGESAIWRFSNSVKHSFEKPCVCLYVIPRHEEKTSLLPLMKIFVRGFIFHLWSWASEWQWHQDDIGDQDGWCQGASSELRRYETRNISIYNKLWPIPPPSIVPGRSYSALCRPPSRLCNIITQHMLCNTVCITSKDVKSSIAAGGGLCYGGCRCRHITRSCTALCISLGLTILWLALTSPGTTGARERWATGDTGRHCLWLRLLYCLYTAAWAQSESR